MNSAGSHPPPDRRTLRAGRQPLSEAVQAIVDGDEVSLRALVHDRPDLRDADAREVALLAAARIEAIPSVTGYGFL